MRQRRGASWGPVAQFAASGLAVLVVLVGAGMFVLDSIARNQALASAREFAQLAARGAVEPYLTDAVVAGDPDALKRLDAVVRDRLLSSSVVRVKLWSEHGRIVYSDEPRLIGLVVPPTPDEAAAIRQGAVRAEVADLSAPENRFDRDFGKLLEVYTPARTPSGEVLRFEVYQRYSSLTAAARDAYLRFGLVALAGLVLLWLLQLPIARSLVRKLRGSQEEREELLLRAIDASDAERRRIAADLHDGVVQDLAGLSFSLAAAADRAAGQDAPEAAAILERAADSSRRAVRQMRSLLVDIYPPNLHAVGLEAALKDLLSPLHAQGVSSELDVEPRLRLAPATERLLFVTAREALRNVARHAEASSTRVQVRGDDGRVELTVDDDGQGVAPEAGRGSAEGGHIGLALLRDLAQRAGGELEVGAREGGGTRVKLGVPSG
jgi:two-component system, NarL family, sensor kinase